MNSQKAAQHNHSPLLSVQHLCVNMQSENGLLSIIRDVSFDVYPGETIGIVGESGSGKTVTCLSLLRLITSPPAVYQGGKVFFRERDLWQASEKELLSIRGRHIAVIFQEALSALNPVIKVGVQVAEVLMYHEGQSKSVARENVLKLFDRVGIPAAEERFEQYPHQLSGGLQQRVMIAMALACRPALLIADEPTTALDVTIQVQILELLKELQQEHRMSMIFISHDLGVIAEMCQRVLVMYAGQVVESGRIESIFGSPRHPYTRLLLKTIPDVNKPRGEFIPIPGQIPSPGNLPPGCAFHPRCPEADATCPLREPPLARFPDNHPVRCWHREGKDSGE